MDDTMTALVTQAGEALQGMQPEIITRRVERVAYPRNGNVGNPTKYYRWCCRSGIGFRRLKDAKAALQKDFGATHFMIVYQ